MCHLWWLVLLILLILMPMYTYQWGIYAILVYIPRSGLKFGKGDTCKLTPLVNNLHVCSLSM